MSTLGRDMQAGETLHTGQTSPESGGRVANSRTGKVPSRRPSHRGLIIGLAATLIVAAAPPRIAAPRPVTSDPHPATTLGPHRLVAAQPAVTFQTAATYSNGAAALRVGTGDADGDGSADVLTANNTTSSVSFLANTISGGRPTGVLSQPALLSASSAGVNAIASGDFNRDGKLDLAVATGGNTIGVMLGQGNGTFGPLTSTQVLPVGNCCSSNAMLAAVADVNGDGKPDIIVAYNFGCICQTESGIAVLYGNGDGTFQPLHTYGIPFAGLGSNGGTQGLAIADLLRNGIPDTIVGIADTGGGFDHGSIWVLSNYATSSNATQVIAQDGARSATGGEAVAAADVTGDGIPDIVSTETPLNQSHRGIHVYPGVGNGTFQAGTYYADPKLTDGTNTFGNVDSVAIGDMNGDGFPDIVTSVAGNGFSGLSIYLNNGNGTFAAPIFVPTPFEGTTMTLADLNQDGLPDVILGNNSVGNNIAVLINTTPVPPKAVEFYGGGSPSEPRLADAHSCVCDPVDTATGNFWHSFDDLSIPGRGPVLHLTRTYNALAAASGATGPFGPGWSWSYGMSLSQDPTTGRVTITEEGGSQIVFTPSGSTYLAPPRVAATLAKNADGTYTFVRGAREKFTFSATGLLTQQTDLNGYTTTLGYNTSNQLTTVTDPAGRTLALGYTGSHLTSATDPVGRTVSYGYNDTAGNLTDVTDVNAGATHFTYDTSHRMLTKTDPVGQVITNVYDPSTGRVASQTATVVAADRTQDRKTTFAYSGDNSSAAGGTTTITDARGNVVQEQYVNSERVATTKAAGTTIASTWQYTYDPITLGIASVIDPNNNSTSTKYDTQGNILMRTDGLQRQTTYKYDTLNDLLTVTDPLLVATTSTYDTSGNLLSTSTPLTGTTQVATVGYGYDPAHPGDVVAKTDSDGKVSRFAYDQYGNRTRATDPLGDTLTSTYDTVGRRLTTVSPNGNTTGANPLAFTTTFVPNAFGDVSSVTDPLGHKTTFKYDGNRNRTSVTDGNLHTTTYTYDLANELTQVTRTDGTTLKTGYDGAGNLTSQTNGLNNSTTYTYDAQNRRSAMIDPLLRKTTYQYDPGGRLQFLVDPVTPIGRTTSYSYDTADERTAITYSDGLTPNVSSLKYDADGQRQSMTDGSGQSVYTVDSLHRLTKMVNGAGQAVQYGYDLKGQLTSITYPVASDVVNRTYDDAGRLASVADWLGNKTTFGYDADSNLTAETFSQVPQGKDSFQYDAADRLMGISDSTTAAGTFLSLGYQRDAVNQVTAENASADIYDTVNRLTKQGTTGYGYDFADNPTGVGGSTLSYDVANQLTSSTGATAAQYTYDVDGNRVKTVTKQVTNYGYDQANRLTSFTSNAQYTYNGDGLRATKVLSGPLAKFALLLPDLLAKASSNGGGATDTFTWDLAEGLPLLLQKSNPQEVSQFISGPGGLPLEQVEGTSVFYYHHDQLGSTRALTDSTGAIAATYSYDAYGNTTASTIGKVTTPLQFAGQYQDAESGLYYMRARYYDPATAQFLSRDPAVAVTRSAYGYVGDNPLNSKDPSGLLDYFDLSDDQRSQLEHECGGWGQPGLCLATAFCSDVIGCAQVAHAAVDLAERASSELAALKSAPCGVSLFGGLTPIVKRSLEQALKEDVAAASVAIQEAEYYQHDRDHLTVLKGAIEGFVSCLPPALAGEGKTESELAWTGVGPFICADIGAIAAQH